MQSLIDSPVNDLMYLFSLVLIRKKVDTGIFRYVISIVIMSTEIIEGE